MKEPVAWVLALCLCLGPAPSPHGGASDPSAGGQLDLARRRVAELEARLYEQEPNLRQVEREYERLRKRYADAVDAQAGVVSKYLEHEDAKRGDRAATKLYDGLRGAWSAVYAAEAAQDPHKSPLLKAVLTSESSRRARLAAEVKQARPELTDAALNDTDRLWDEFRAASAQALPRLREAAQRLEKQSGFPEFVLEQARVVSASKFDLDWIYFPYIQLQTPEELRRARQALQALSTGGAVTTTAATSTTSTTSTTRPAR